MNVISLIKGKHEEGFNLLARYTEMIKISSPGSICYSKWHDSVEEGEDLFSQECLSLSMLGRRAS